jgi:putative transposase
MRTAFKADRSGPHLGQANAPGCIKKKCLKISQLKVLVQTLKDQYKVSTQKAFQAVMLSRSLWYRQSTKRSDKAIRSRIVEITNTRIRYGVNRIHVLLRREGWKDNKKRVHRIYK